MIESENSSTMLNPELLPDIDKAYGHLHLIDPDAKKFNFLAFPEKGTEGDGRYARSLVGNIYDLETELVDLNIQRYGIAVCVNSVMSGKRRKVRYIDRIRAFVLEDDEIRQNYRTDFPIPPSMIIESSLGKYHYYWMCDGISPRNFSDIQRCLIQNYGCDPAWASSNEVIRIAGFLHQKAEPFETRIVHSSLIRYAREHIVAAFPPVPELPASKYSVSSLSQVDREKLKDGAKFNGEGVAWRLQRNRKGKAKVTIRFSVKTHKGSVYLHRFIELPLLTTSGMLVVNKYSQMWNDLATLRVLDKYPNLNQVPISVFDEYCGKPLQLLTKHVQNERNPHGGNPIERSAETVYSKVFSVFKLL